MGTSPKKKAMKLLALHASWLVVVFAASFCFLKGGCVAEANTRSNGREGE